MKCVATGVLSGRSFFLTAIDHADFREMAIAGKLAGEPALRVSRIGGGRSSRVFRAETTNDRAFYPLFGLRWVLILLNEFHPERWRRRVLAGTSDGWSEAKDRQLNAARVMLNNSTGMLPWRL